MPAATQCFPMHGKARSAAILLPIGAPNHCAGTEGGRGGAPPAVELLLVVDRVGLKPIFPLIQLTIALIEARKKRRGRVVGVSWVITHDAPRTPKPPLPW